MVELSRRDFLRKAAAATAAATAAAGMPQIVGAEGPSPATDATLPATDAIDAILSEPNPSLPQGDIYHPIEDVEPSRRNTSDRDQPLHLAGEVPIPVSNGELAENLRVWAIRTTSKTSDTMGVWNEADYSFGDDLTTQMRRILQGTGHDVDWVEWVSGVLRYSMTNGEQRTFPLYTDPEAEAERLAQKIIESPYDRLNALSSRFHLTYIGKGLFLFHHGYQAEVNPSNNDFEGRLVDLAPQAAFYEINDSGEFQKVEDFRIARRHTPYFVSRPQQAGPHTLMTVSVDQLRDRTVAQMVVPATGIRNYYTYSVRGSVGLTPESVYPGPLLGVYTVSRQHYDVDPDSLNRRVLIGRIFGNQGRGVGGPISLRFLGDREHYQFLSPAVCADSMDFGQEVSPILLVSSHKYSDYPDNEFPRALHALPIIGNGVDREHAQSRRFDDIIDHIAVLPSYRNGSNVVVIDQNGYPRMSFWNTGDPTIPDFDTLVDPDRQLTSLTATNQGLSARDVNTGNGLLYIP